MVQSVSIPQSGDFDPELSDEAIRLLYSRVSPLPEAWLGKKVWGDAIPFALS